MNFAELEMIWNSGGNQPSAGQREKITRHALEWVRRQRRHQGIWLVWTFGVLTVLTSFAGWVLFGTDKVDLGREWGVIPLLLLPWTFAVIFLKRFLKPEMAVVRGDMPIAEALGQAIRTNEASQFRLRAMGVLYAVFVPVLAVGMWQLHLAGKASSRELFSMAVFFGGVLLLSGAGVFARYRFRLKPQHQQLKAVLGYYEEGASASRAK
jgi:hypothetical protein